MAKLFPLYDRLRQKTQTMVEPVQLGSICATITNIKTLESPYSDEHFYNLAALIVHHELVSNGFLSSNRPYGIDVFTGGKGIIVKMADLPKPLQQIIAEYIKENS